MPGRIQIDIERFQAVSRSPMSRVVTDADTANGDAKLMPAPGGFGRSGAGQRLSQGYALNAKFHQEAMAKIVDALTTLQGDLSSASKSVTAADEQSTTTMNNLARTSTALDRHRQDFSTAHYQDAERSGLVRPPAPGASPRG